MTTTVYVQDVTDHRVHRRFREDGERGLYAHGAEVPDTSGAYIVLTDAEMERVPAEWMCSRCFGASPALEVIG